MTLLADLAAEIRKMFAANLGLTLAVVAILLAATLLGRGLHQPLAALAVLLIAPPVALAVSLSATARKHNRNRA